MELLPAELRNVLPQLDSQENPKDPTVYIKFFTPDSKWTWYVTEGSQRGNDFEFFGYVIGVVEGDWGYFSLSELQKVRGPHRLSVERDTDFKPVPFSQISRS